MYRSTPRCPSHTVHHTVYLLAEPKYCAVLYPLQDVTIGSVADTTMAFSHWQGKRHKREEGWHDKACRRRNATRKRSIDRQRIQPLLATLTVETDC